MRENYQPEPQPLVVVANENPHLVGFLRCTDLAILGAISSQNNRVPDKYARGSNDRATDRKHGTPLISLRYGQDDMCR